MGLVVLGFVVGGGIGFMLRPSAFIVGQLPFQTVITQGTALSGLDQLLIPTAQQSFNVMLIGAAVGAVIGFVLHRVMAKGRG